jgi:MoaA/NifB/PqqE/SkfB family radical SAM enzyme
MKEINVPINSADHIVSNDFIKEWEKHKDQRYMEYRMKWVENPKNFILEEAPLHLDIESTNACNLKCPMCPRTALLNDSNENNKFIIGKMDITTFQRLIDEAVEIGVYSVKLNWLGEPLLHPDIVEMVRYAKKKGILDVMFNTNAVLLTEELSRKLIESNLDKIFFSFDSPNKKTYEQIRIGAKYEETLDNIKTFVGIRNKLQKNSPFTRVSMVLMEKNKNEYNEFVDLFRNIVDVVAYVEYRAPFGTEEKAMNKNKKCACSQLWQRMFIDWSGDCMICCADDRKECVVGSIHKNTIKEIWKSDEYMKLRNYHKTGDFYKIDICKKCTLLHKECKIVELR